MVSYKFDSILRYEAAFAQMVGASNGFSFWKGRVALFAILRALKIGAGDEVILPGFTCVVVPNAIRMTGATPIYADISPGTFNIDPDSVERSITPRIRVLIIQHTFGIPAEMKALLQIARQHNLAVIEDCAHSLGSTFEGQVVGTFGVGAFYSFQWSKPFTTGLGGIAITSDTELAQNLRKIQKEFEWPHLFDRLRLGCQYHIYQRYFSPTFFWTAMKALSVFSRLGIFVGSSDVRELSGGMPEDGKWRMSSMQARTGLKQLAKWSTQTEHRRQLSGFYADFFRKRDWPLVTIPPNVEVLFLRYPLRVANKQEILRLAQNERIEIGSWMETVLHPVGGSLLDGFGYKTGLCSVAEKAAAEVINLPVHPLVSINEAQRIADFVDLKAKIPTPVSVS